MTAADWGRRFMQGSCRGSAGAALLLALFLCGCVSNARLLSIEEQKPIDRSFVEFPSGYQFRRYVTALTAPTAIAFDAEGSLLIAMGERDDEVRIIGFRTDG